MIYEDEVNSLLQKPERGNLELLSGQLCSEAGEVFGCLTKINRAAYKIQRAPEGSVDLNAYTKELAELWERFDKELGDCLFYLAAIAKHRETTLAKLQEANISKLKDRLARNVLTSGSGDLR